VRGDACVLRRRRQRSMPVCVHATGAGLHQDLRFLQRYATTRTSISCFTPPRAPQYPASRHHAHLNILLHATTDRGYRKALVLLVCGVHGAGCCCGSLRRQHVEARVNLVSALRCRINSHGTARLFGQEQRREFNRRKTACALTMLSLSAKLLRTLTL
jgi:hypothetical protein